MTVQKNKKRKAYAPPSIVPIDLPGAETNDLGDEPMLTQGQGSSPNVSGATAFPPPPP